MIGVAFGIWEALSAAMLRMELECPTRVGVGKPVKSHYFAFLTRDGGEKEPGN